MPLYDRFTQGIRSDGRGNFRYRPVGQDDLLQVLQDEHGWTLNGDFTLAPPPAAPPVQYTTFFMGARAVVQEQRPFCAPAVRRELEQVCYRGLEMGAEYTTPMATYRGVRVTTTGLLLSRSLVERTALPGGGRMSQDDCVVLLADEVVEPLGDPELNRLLAEEQAIEDLMTDRQQAIAAAVEVERDAYQADLSESFRQACERIEAAEWAAMQANPQPCSQVFAYGTLVADPGPQDICSPDPGPCEPIAASSGRPARRRPRPARVAWEPEVRIDPPSPWGNQYDGRLP